MGLRETNSRVALALCLGLLLIASAAAGSGGRKQDGGRKRGGGGDQNGDENGEPDVSCDGADDPKCVDGGNGTALADKWKSIRFHFGGNFEPYDFLVTVPGEPETQDGFGVRFLKGLCAKYDLECLLIRDSYQNCWNNEDFPGRGIQSGWYDACGLYFDTPIRHTGVTMSNPIVDTLPAGLVSRLDKDGNPVVHPMDDDLKGKKVGFVGGWSTSPASFQHVINGCTGKQFTNFEAVVVDDKFAGPDSAFRALIDGKVDALFVFGFVIEERKGCMSSVCEAELYQGLGTQYAWIHTGMFEYQLNGVTLAFTPKGSDLVEFLNPLIAEYIKTREYADLCAEYVSAEINCFSNEHLQIVQNSLNHLTDEERVEECAELDDPECGDCSTGFCICTVP